MYILFLSSVSSTQTRIAFHGENQRRFDSVAKDFNRARFLANVHNSETWNFVLDRYRKPMSKFKSNHWEFVAKFGLTTSM